MGPLDRREFLQHSAAISAALAAYGTGFSRATAAPASAAKKASANDTLRVAVVGVRGRGMAHVNGFAGRSGCEITTVCDCDSAVIGNAMKTVEKRQGKAPQYVQDVRKVMEDKNIDIVAIATPNHWHALAAIWAMQNGKDVYVEKPVSHNVWEGRKIVEASRRHNRICQTGTQSRSMPGMREAIAYVQSGKLGKVRLAYGTCYKRRNSIGKVDGVQAVPKTIDYNLWCGPAPELPLHRKNLHYDWHWIWAYGNGDLGNQGIHEMDKARWGLGKKELPRSVISLGGRFGYVDDGQTANTQLCVFDYGDSELIFEVRGLPTKDFRGAMVGNVYFGSEGVVVCPSYSGGFLLDNDGKKVKEFKGSGGDGNHFDNFIKAVRARDRSILNADIEEGHLSSALCHLGNISYRLGVEKPIAQAGNFTDDKDAVEAFKRMIQHLQDNNVPTDKAVGRIGPRLPIDPKAEHFTGNNAQANGLIRDQYRKGFEITDKV